MPKKLNINDYIGQKFGGLTILEFIGYRTRATSSKTDPFVKCRCDCGNVVDKNIFFIIYGNVRFCDQKCAHKSSKRINLVGQKFGFLTVVKHSISKNKNTYWECICTCNTTKIIRGSHLVAGRIQSCGCQTVNILSNKNRKYEPHIASARHIYITNYKDGYLTFDQFFTLSQLPCFYCKSLPNNYFNTFIGKSTSKYSLENGLFIYNGLDRIDSSRNHDIDNVVSCCATCNYAKLQLQPSEFKIWLLNISSNYLFDLSPKELQEAISQYKDKIKCPKELK